METSSICSDGVYSSRIQLSSEDQTREKKVTRVYSMVQTLIICGLFSGFKNTWQDYRDETGNSRAKRTNFSDSADFVGWYANKGFYQGFSATDARSLYLAYHEGYSGFKKKTYRKKQWLIRVADRVQARSNMYQKQYWGCAKELKKKRFFFF